jgi:hypothetical protein
MKIMRIFGISINQDVREVQIHSPSVKSHLPPWIYECAMPFPLIITFLYSLGDSTFAIMTYRPRYYDLF